MPHGRRREVPEEWDNWGDERRWEMNPWLIVGGGGVVLAVSKRARSLLRTGAVHGLSTAISVGDAAVTMVRGATTQVGHTASSMGETAVHGASAVVAPIGSIVSEAKTHVHEGTKAEEPVKKTPARRKRVPA